MLIFKILSLLIVLDPTMLDRSDYQNSNIQRSRYITARTIPNGGFAESLQTLAGVHRPEMALVDNDTIDYWSFEDETGWAFNANWIVRAAVTRDRGLVITENNRLLYTQNRCYTNYQATVRIAVHRETLLFYLDGVLVFASNHPGLGARDLRGYVYDSATITRIGIPVARLFVPQRRGKR